MKKIIFFVFLLFGLNTIAQTNLGISSLGADIPDDTVMPGFSDTYDVWVKNYGNTAFNGYADIMLAARDSSSPSGLDSTQFVASDSVYINPGDSALITLSNNYTVSPGTFRYGINVIVVWPVAAMATTVDSIEYTVYIMNPNSVQEIDISDLFNIYPNPTSGLLNIVQLNSSRIESVRIYDIHGRLILSEGHSTMICIETLAEGMYHVEVIMSDKKHYYRKIIKK
ncbi:MAG: hypothetical protein K0Q95_1916 [Bacteroidota bacterium]|jgi:hypothetical protein|nr:hypothetical protein [Bacteroidota bacterium]